MPASLFVGACLSFSIFQNNKAHPRFKNVAQVEMNLLSRAGQTGEDKSEAVTIGEAVAKGTVNNETLGYFMARSAINPNNTTPF